MINANNQTKLGVRKYHCLCHKQKITKQCYSAIPEITCNLFVNALQVLNVEIEMKNLNLQVTLLVQKDVGRRSHIKKGAATPLPPHYTSG